MEARLTAYAKPINTDTLGSCGQTINSGRETLELCHMATDLSDLKNQVGSYLPELFPDMEIDADGYFTFRHNNTRVWVACSEFHEDSTVVEIFAMTNMQVPPTPEFFKFVAMQNTYLFGHISCREDEGKIVVSFGHNLLGDCLDPEEFKVALFMVVGIADELDDEINSRFGGQLFLEDE